MNIASQLRPHLASDGKQRSSTLQARRREEDILVHESPPSCTRYCLERLGQVGELDRPIEGLRRRGLRVGCRIGLGADLFGGWRRWPRSPSWWVEVFRVVIHRMPMVALHEVGRYVVDKEVDAEAYQQSQGQALDRLPMWRAGGSPVRLGPYRGQPSPFVIVVLLSQFLIAEEQGAHVSPEPHCPDGMKSSHSSCAHASLVI